MLGIILIDYFAAIVIEKSSGKNRRLCLIISIVLTCLGLVFFKYINFVNDNLRVFAGFLHWNYSISFLKLALPVGLSFQTFQSLAYLIEVYRKNQKAERNLSSYALFILFFPIMVSGPIERPQNLLHQFYEKHYFDYQRVVDGLKLIVWGMFKKVVVADRLAAFVNEVYNSPANYRGITLILATFFFAYQIYCDFSGYSDMAIGAARVMGFRLIKNFDSPYFAISISEFWRKWHISLSSWFRDFLYIPLGGNRVSKARKCLNILTTFLVCGFWHGANWTFVIWGGLNGVYLIFEDLTKKLREKIEKDFLIHRIPAIKNFICVFLTFLLVCLSWIPFRANSLKEVLIIAGRLFSNSGQWFNQPKMEFGIAILGIMSVWLFDYINYRGNIRKTISEYPVWVRWLLYYLLIMGIIVLKAPVSSNFIYYQF